MRVAVDVGASATKVAVVGDDDVVRLVRSGGSGEFPSAVYAARNGGVHVGARALAYAVQDPTRLTTSLKRVINTPSAVAPVDRTVVLGGSRHRVVDLIAAIVGHALAVVPVDGDDADLDLVLTHPVSWGDAEREVLALAARRAGVISEPRFVSEPGAVAAHVIAAGLASPQDGAVAVFDLGASTFDAAVVVTSDDEGLRTVSDLGRLVGGQDVDVALVDSLALAWPAEQATLVERLRDDPVHAHGLGAEARRLKERLSDVTEDVFAFEGLGDTEVDRDDLDDALDPIADACFAAFEQCLAALPGRTRVGTIVGSGGSLRIPALHERLEDMGRERGAKVIAPATELGLGQLVALGALHAVPPGWRYGLAPRSHTSFPLPGAAVLPFGRDRYAWGDAQSRWVHLWSDAGPGESVRVPTGGEFARVRAVGADPVTGRLITGTDNGCVEIWNVSDGVRVEATPAPTAFLGSMRGENVTAVAMEHPFAAHTKEEKPGAIHHHVDGSWRRRATLRPASPEFLGFVCGPDRLVVVDMPDIELVDVDGLCRDRIDYPGRFSGFRGADVSRRHGLLAVSSAEALLLVEVGRAELEVVLRLPGDHGPVGLIDVDDDAVFLVCAPGGNSVTLLDPNGDVLGVDEVEGPVEALHTFGTGGQYVVASGDALLRFELSRTRS